MARVYNMTSPRTDREVPNQFIIETDNGVTFQSYDSMIAQIDYDSDTITIGRNYDYSMTTGKYRNAFFEQMGFRSLATLKDLNKAIIDGYCQDRNTVTYTILLED